MNRDLAKNFIEDIFTKEFEKSKFIDFTNTLLYSAHFDPTMVANKNISDLFKDHIESVEILASFEDSKEHQIDLLIITLFKDTALSLVADEGYYVHSSSFSVNSKNQISSSLGSPNHTSSFFVMGVFKHPFIPGIDGNIMNYSSSQNREPGISATSWVNHHTIASCIFLKKYDDTVFIFHPSASGFVTSESVG